MLLVFLAPGTIKYRCRAYVMFALGRLIGSQ